jgi:small subunit ribosomal protein S24e
MDVKIISKTEKPLLERTELIGEIGFEAVTPSRVDVRKKMATALNVSEDLIVVTKITPMFGERKAKLAVNLYKKKECLQKCESPVAKERNFPTGAAKVKKEKKTAEKAKK